MVWRRRMPSRSNHRKPQIQLVDGAGRARSAMAAAAGTALLPSRLPSQLSKSPLGQLEFDAAIAPVGVLARAAFNRLKFAEAGSHEPRWLHPFCHHVLHHRDGPSGGEIPIRSELPDHRAHVGMAVNAQNPGNVGWDLPLEFDDRGCDFVEFGATFRLQIGPAGVEEYFGLKDEAVADDANVRPVAENLAQLAEEIRTVSRELLKMLGERNIQALTKLADTCFGIFI